MNIEKLTLIVERLAADLDIRFQKKSGNGSNLLQFEGKNRGIECCLFFSQQSKNKIKAYFSVGRYSYGNFTFANRIYFNDEKSEKAIIRDLMQRLELEKINEKIDEVFAFRAKKQAEEDLKNAELAAFQRFIPFEKTNYKDYFAARTRGAYFELTQDKKSLNLRVKNQDILLRICAAAAQILEEEAAKESTQK
ncbi:MULTISPECIES: hypothetical protein [Haemophilus]|uniref:Uncharacterized protein n=1 Tax=Haemophilus influenzae biotype aegyptius TaxID=725 RepID=Q4L0U4_HAEIF|nr:MULTISPECIES: hypothetical protein [Haemophilus]AAV40877.1 hypothetical protein [Haemophilus influenzae biotype aegyptius]OBX79654.1 hypothetical protein A9506_03565 [Haemophilus aegyptius]STO67401.1 Uncharacterised protein [Haemophilus aegyptius]